MASDDTLAKLAAHESETTVWLLAVGNDGIGSELVTGWTALRRAWLDNHRSFVDHDNLTDEDRETLSLLDDDDEWKHDDSGARFSLSVNYEGDWISVTRVDGAAHTAQAPAAADGRGNDAQIEKEREIARHAIVGALAAGRAGQDHPGADHWLAAAHDAGVRIRALEDQAPPAAEPGAPNFERMFMAACEALGSINEALGLDPNDGGAESILDAIEELKAAHQEAQATPKRQDASVITDGQITAGAAVLDMKGKPIGRNVAIAVFETMCAVQAAAS